MEERFDLSHRRVVRTKFGRSLLYHARAGERSFYVLPRHGIRHNLPPHKINYRANIAALDQLGVRKVIATTAVGSMNPEFRVGELGLLEQFIDFTKGRDFTFFDDEVRHTDMTHPYDRDLGELLAESASRLRMELRKGLVYVCAEGPRYESAAEIKMFRSSGGDVVGMTGVPEVVLANELGLKYASVAIATNWAAGIQERVTHSEVASVMRRSGTAVKRLLEDALGSA